MNARNFLDASINSGYILVSIYLCVYKLGSIINMNTRKFLGAFTSYFCWAISRNRYEH
ncbi:MAG: hypothetical protein IJS99_08090 [Synergistaceae bacterium]|nr:hypothetical protein [Synergistaceae bacterium]